MSLDGSGKGACKLAPQGKERQTYTHPEGEWEIGLAASSEGLKAKGQASTTRQSERTSQLLGGFNAFLTFR